MRRSFRANSVTSKYYESMSGTLAFLTVLFCMSGLLTGMNSVSSLLMSRPLMSSPLTSSPLMSSLLNR